MTASAASRPSLGARFARGAAWSVVGAASGQALQMAGSVLTARILGPESYGQLGIVMSTVGMFGVVASFGMGVTATRFVAMHRDSDPARAGSILTLTLLATSAFGLLAAAAMALASGMLAEGPLSDGSLAPELRVAALFLVANALGGAVTAALTGLEAFRAAGVIALASAIVGLPVRVWAAWALGLSGSVWAMVAVSLVSLGMGALALRRALCARRIALGPPRLGGDLRLLLRYALPALLMGALSLPAQWLANTLLAGTSRGYAELGLLNATTQWRTLLLFIPTVLGGVALPLMASGELTGEAEGESERAFELTQVLTMLAVIPAGCVLVFLAQPILLLYGPGYAGGWVAVIGSVAAAVVGSATIAPSTGLQATGRLWRGVGCSAAWSLLVVGAAALGAERWGASSVAFGQAGGYMLSAPLMLLSLGRAVPRSAWSCLAGQFAIVAIAVAAALSIPPSMGPWLSAPAGLAATVLCWRLLARPELRERAAHHLRERLAARLGG